MSQSRKRTFKVSLCDKPEQRYGLSLANATLDAVLEAACKKLKLSPRGATLRTASDNTIIDDDEYLLSDELKPPNNHLVVVPKGQNYDSTEDLLRQLMLIQNRLGQLHDSHPEDVSRKLDEFRDRSAKHSIVVDGVATLTTSTAHVSTREEDPDWFIDIPNRFKTKEKFMRDRARGRVAGYLKVTKSFVKDYSAESKHPEAVKTVLEQAVQDLTHQLKPRNYFEGYFDRTNAEHRFCDRDGDFFCQGIYNEDGCNYKSVINPYNNGKHRIEFSSWNLDHVIEKSRSVLPNLRKAAEHVVQSKGRDEVNIDYFFSLLFTKNNLKLVETACHDKTEHTDRDCDPKMITRRT
ncbi:DNA fragmentation factor subunit beta-like [Sycon ciliatum]|uniref:DNA fragmentation factor subunit beta-like n=1 Tax=Sycon ciliatum TaxID=27933 RepID=UPI0031F61AE8